MTFEFIIVYRPSEGESISDILQARLREALEENPDDVDESAFAHIVINFERLQPKDDDGAHFVVLGFSLELMGEESSICKVVDQFAGSLVADPITHAVKYEDPSLLKKLAKWTRDLFALEMKLRRVLSIIYLHAYPGSDPYNLLQDEAVKPMKNQEPQEDQMKAATENQFFHLTFGQYVHLNQRPAIKDIASLIEDQATYEQLRSELIRQPVGDEGDADFLASLKELMDPVEKMRNAVALNRLPPKNVKENYEKALPLVDEALGNYLNALKEDWKDLEEWPWDTEAREAVERAMESAAWDEDGRVITCHDADDPRISDTVRTREELVIYLEEVARTGFYATCPRDDGGFLFECDETDVVENILADYEERLDEFFGEPT